MTSSDGEILTLDEINQQFVPENVKFEVADSFGKWMEVVK